MNDLKNYSKNMPIDSLNVKGINLAVWKHKKDDREYKQITLKKNYKDQESGDLKETNSFNIHDIPYIIQELQEVYSKELRGEY